jgi:hypothetical protein
LDHAHFRLFIDSTKTVTIKYVIDQLLGTKKDTLKKDGWDVSFNNIGLLNSRFSLEDFAKTKKDSGINFSNLQVNYLNTRVKNLKIVDGIASFKINKLSFIEETGFRLNYLSAKMSIGHNLMHFDNVNIITPESDINAPKVYFDFIDFGDFSFFVEKVKVVFEINKAKSNFSDIAYFAPTLWGINEPFKFSGISKGKISDLKCKNILFEVKSTSFHGNISLTGLPNIESTYIYIDSKNLTIDPVDIHSFYIPNTIGNKINLPPLVDKLGVVTFKGNFTGFINDFVAYGVFKTELGIVTTDLSIKPETKNKLIVIGSVVASQFNIGKLLSQEQLIGTANIELNSNISIENKSNVSGTIDSKVNQLVFNGYTYSSINANGELTNNAFNGSISLNDKNIILDILGQFDLTKTIPEFNFSANLTKAELHNLHFANSDTSFIVMGEVLANFKGNNLSNIYGEINFKKAILQRADKTLNINNFKFSSQKNATGRFININSSILDASIDGDIDMGSLPVNLMNTLKIYLPESFYKKKNAESLANNHFKFNFLFKNTKPFFDFFVPGVFVEKNSIFSGYFYPSDSSIQFSLSSDLLQYKNQKLVNVDFIGKANHDSASLKLTSNKFISGTQLDLNLFQTIITSKKDSIFSHIYWSNRDSIGGKSHIYVLSNFIQRNLAENPYLNIHLFPGKIFPADSIWVINDSYVSIDSSSIKVPNISIQQGTQLFEATGTISENPNDSLLFNFKNFDLQNLRFLIQTTAFNFKGKIDGKTELLDFYNKRLINSDLLVNNFTINDELIGNTGIQVNWDNSNQKIEIKAEAEINNSKSAVIKGFVKPSTSELDFDVELNKIGLKLFQPAIESVFLLQNGFISGKISLAGKTYAPILNGSLNIDNALFTLKYLNTTYSFNTLLKIKNNDFILDNVKIYDQDKNSGYVNGRIINKNFADISINLNLNISKLRVLNTGINDNNPFYGLAFASGEINITGPLNKLDIDVVRAQTEGKTVFAIPINNKMEVKQNYFLNFTKKKEIGSNDSISINKKYEVNLSGLNLSMNLDVTRDAEVQLVFDSKLGDVMTSRGRGNLRIDVSSAGDVQMRGNYYVESGIYWFTLQNLINKKFELQPGGIISWTGNPVDANLDVKAIYHTKASLFNLDQSRADLKKRINVDCNLGISGKLLNPEIKYNIVLPNANEETRNTLRDATNTDEALSTQFFALLIIQNFIPNTTNNLNDISSGLNTNTIGRDLATTTSIELLSSQLSSWLSKVSKDIDVGINYRPGESKMTNQEIELALSTQILNDKVTINGNIDVVGNQVNPTNQNKATNIVGDVNIEYKLTEKVKLKFYNHANDQILYEQEPYTQGVGVFYREEFSTFGELTRRYYRNLFASKKDSSKTSKIK